jgi:hypothetical protein
LIKRRIILLDKLGTTWCGAIFEAGFIGIGPLLLMLTGAGFFQEATSLVKLAMYMYALIPANQ